VKSIKIAIIGFGNIGQAFLSHCLAHTERLRDRYDTRLMLVGVADTSGIAVSAYGLKPKEILEAKQEGKRLSELDEGMSCNSDSYVWRFKSAGANVIIETLPSNLEDGEPAYEIIEHAFAEYMHVVSANKGAMVRGLRRLETAAKEEGVGFAYSAATGGALPTVGFGWRELAGAEINEISGVLNTTTNYILSSMDESRTYDEALAEAQRLGMAEPNPAQDVEGRDTAA
jgi:homoserine dehydrogenase